MNILFPAGKPVAGNMLIGRTELSKELDAILSISQSVILVAPRRYGKTSLALETLKNFRNKGYFISEIDMFDITSKRRLAEILIESCLKNNPVPLERYWKKLKNGALNVLSMLKFKPSDEDMEMVLQLGMPSIDEDKLLDGALDFPEKFCCRHKKKMIMLIDEFQETVKIGGDALLKKMRSKFQKHTNVIYMFAGSQESLMKKIFQSKQHAFYRFGRIIEVGNIARKDFSKYILKSFTGEKIKIDLEHVDAILEITDGHPYYTQLLCQMLYITCLTNKKYTLNQTDVVDAQDRVVEHEKPLFDEIWSELGNKKFAKNIISLIAEEKSPYLLSGTSKENTARILNDLLHYGYIAKSGQGKNIKYYLKDSFFKKYTLSKVNY